MSEHIIEALGLSRITIRNGKVVEVTEPEVEYCPLFDHHRGIKKLTTDVVAKNIQFRIDDFGMCTANRQLRMKDFLNFGISEILCTLLEKEVIDSVVMVLEGCGTVIVREPELVQGIGGRVSGLVKTSPIPELFDEIGEDNILNTKTAEINQGEGIKLAIEKGCKNIAVTVALASDIDKINRLKDENPDINIYVFVVHTSKRTPEEARKLFDGCDVATACASKNIRDIGEKESVKIVGQSIPIYARTEAGKRFLEMRLEKIGGEKPKKENPDLPYPLI
ncbi:methanogenesis marker 8 protein [uncultured Methanobrevibacter sp.]|uniref:methanogenesis marker 8 protein n=1 Tax=uncultured Methanobrevibacter sp. TaxID=253161 RepID=UPI0026304DE6|nr:methanogenesis marker 8 protein [uncultured Methanobrevibacter sp.]